MSKFEVGKTYHTRKYADKRTVVAVAVDGRLIVSDIAGNLTYRNSDGTSQGSNSLDIVIPPVVVTERRRVETNDYNGVNIGYRGCENVEFTFTDGKLTGVKLL